MTTETAESELPGSKSAREAGGQEAAVAFAAALCLTYLMFQLALVYSLSSDSYYLIQTPQILVNQHSATARPLAAMLQWVIAAMGIDIIKSQWWTAWISIVVLALAVTVLYRRLIFICRRSDLYFQICALLCAFLAVVNPFMSEWFVFSFITPMDCLAVLFAVLGAVRLARAKLSTRDVALVFLFAVASANLFQSPVSLMAPLAVVLIASSGASVGVLFRRTLLGIAAYVAAGASSFLYLRELHPLFSKLVDTRTTRLDLAASLAAVVREQRAVWIDSFNLLPKYLFAGFLLAALALFLLAKRPAAASGVRWGLAIAVTLAIGLSFGPHVVTAVVWIVPRSLTTVAALPGLVLLFALCSGAGNVWWKGALACGAAFYLLVSMSSANRVLADHLSSDRQDQEEARMMAGRIAAYEQQSHIAVRQVVFLMDRYPMWCYPDVKCFGDLNVRSWVKAYARIPLLAIAGGRRLTEVPFAGQTVTGLFGVDNWNAFSPDQIRFIGDTAYIAIY